MRDINKPTNTVGTGDSNLPAIRVKQNNTGRELKTKASRTVTTSIVSNVARIMAQRMLRNTSEQSNDFFVNRGLISRNFIPSGVKISNYFRSLDHDTKDFLWRNGFFGHKPALIKQSED